MKALFDKHSGCLRFVKDYIETPKRFKVVEFDDSYSLWKKDSYEVVNSVLFEGGNREDIKKQRHNFIVDNVNNLFNELMKNLDFSKLTVLNIEDHRYSFWFTWKEVGTDCTKDITIRVACGGDDNTEYREIVFKLINKHIISKKCMFRKEYRTSYNKLVKNRDNSVSPIGLFINKDVIEPLLPDEITIGKKYHIGGIGDHLTMEIPTRFDGYSDYPSDNDFTNLPFAADELNKISKRVKIISNNEKHYEQPLEAFILIRDSYVSVRLQENNDAPKYIYEHLGSNNIKRLYLLNDSLYELRNNKNTFKFKNGDIEMYFTEGFIMNELIAVKTEKYIASNYKLVFNSAEDCYPLSGRSDLISERQHHIPVLLSELKKYLGTTSYNTWLLMGELMGGRNE